MSLLDILTGGENQNAKNALEKAQEAFANIPVPTAAQLTLPELQKYVEAGIMTPAQAQTALQQGNAYNDIKVDPSTMESEQKALGQLQDLSSAGGMNAEMKAQLADALNQVQTQEQGANASILDQLAQRGIPTSLMGAAAQSANAGQESQNANLTATNAAGQAEANAIQAMMNSGNLASTMHGQQYGEAADKAAAQNAMQQWNAGATNTTGLANAAYQQQANAYNAENKQNVSNQNTGVSNQRTEYNAQVPETIFQNQMQKAGGQSNIYGEQADQATNAGNQMMGLIGGAIGSAAKASAPAPVYNFAAPKMSPASKAPAGYNPNMTEDMLPGGYTGGIAMKDGGPVPGHALVPGDSPENDIVHAKLSPGEIVVPRSIAPHPEAVKRFVQHLAYNKPIKPVHPHDVNSVLEALSMRRGA